MFAKTSTQDLPEASQRLHMPNAAAVLVILTQVSPCLLTFQQLIASAVRLGLHHNHAEDDSMQTNFVFEEVSASRAGQQSGPGRLSQHHHRGIFGQQAFQKKQDVKSKPILKCLMSDVAFAAAIVAIDILLLRFLSSMHGDRT